MLRTILMVGLVLSWTALALGQESLEQYIERQARERRAAADRYERWVTERAQRTEAWRKAEAAKDQALLELPNPGLPPGEYSIRLPFGVTRRVVVAEDAAARLNSALSEQGYADVYAYVRRINRQLGDLEIELGRLGLPELRADAGQIRAEGARLANMITERRPVLDLKGQLAVFDKQWQSLSYGLVRRSDLGSFVPRAVKDLEELNAALQQLLAGSPVVTYDRPVVAVLTGELVLATRNLATDLHLDRDRRPELASLAALASRVERQAADLDVIVRANAALSTIVKEYEEFVRDWDRLLDEAYLAPEVDKQLRVVARRVREIDLQLHPALYVNVPLLTTHQQVVNLSTAITRTAAHLADDLEADALPEDKDVVYEARLFTRVAQELNRALAQAEPADVQLKAVRDLTGAWQRLQTNLTKLPPARFEHGLAIAAELEKDVRSLQTHFRES
jgi:hypothetical protein